MNFIEREPGHERPGSTPVKTESPHYPDYYARYVEDCGRRRIGLMEAREALRCSERPEPLSHLEGFPERRDELYFGIIPSEAQKIPGENYLDHHLTRGADMIGEVARRSYGAAYSAMSIPQEARMHAAKFLEAWAKQANDAAESIDSTLERARLTNRIGDWCEKHLTRITDWATNKFEAIGKARRDAKTAMENEKVLGFVSKALKYTSRGLEKTVDFIVPDPPDRTRAA